MDRSKLTDSALDMIAARFKLLAESSRLKLIIALEDGERNVTDLVETTGLSQANVSRHLAALVNGGILSRRRNGLNVFYFIADESIFELCETVCGSLQERLEQQSNVLPS